MSSSHQKQHSRCRSGYQRWCPISVPRGPPVPTRSQSVDGVSAFLSNPISPTSGTNPIPYDSTASPYFNVGTFIGGVFTAALSGYYIIATNNLVNVVEGQTTLSIRRNESPVPGTTYTIPSTNAYNHTVILQLDIEDTIDIAITPSVPPFTITVFPANLSFFLLNTV